MEHTDAVTGLGFNGAGGVNNSLLGAEGGTWIPNPFSCNFYALPINKSKYYTSLVR